MRKLTLFFVALMCLGFTMNAQVDLQDGLVAHYPFNGNANDESIYTNHGTINGATLVPDRLGNDNSAFAFDGLNDYIECGSDPYFDGAVSVSVWVNFHEINLNEVKRIMGKGLAGDLTIPGWSINLKESNKISFFWEDYDDTNNEIVSTVEVEASRYYHIVVTLDPNTYEYKLYIDNNLEATGIISNPPAPNDDNLIIGARLVDTGIERYLNGEVDDIRIYNRAVNEDEIRALYGEGQQLPVVENESGCEGSTIPNLTAQGQNVKWYADVDLTTLLFEGSSFATGETIAGVYTYYVTQTINGIESHAVEVTLTIHNSMPSDPAMPSGASEICGSAVDSYYTVTEIENAESYIWQIAPNDAGTISGTTSTAMVTWNELYSGNAQISVIAVNSCGQSNPSENLLVSINEGAYVTSLLNQIAQLEAQLLTANDSIVDLNTDLTSANDSIIVLNSDLTTANDSITLLHTELALANEAVTELEAENTQLQSELTIAIDSITTLNAQLTIANGTIEDLQAQIAALQNGFAIDGEQSIDNTTTNTYDYKLMQEENLITEQVNWILTDADNTVIDNTVASEFAITADELANGEYWLLCRYNNDFVGMQKITATDGTSVRTTSANNIVVYPNPTKNVLNIIGVSQNAKIMIYNNSGNLVLEKEDDLNAIDVSSLTRGAYFLNVFNGNELMTTKKFIKK